MSIVKSGLDDYMIGYLRDTSPHGTLAETLRMERENYEDCSGLKSQAENLRRFIETIRQHPEKEFHRIHTLTPEQITFLTNQGFSVTTSDRMHDGEMCYYVRIP